MDKRKYICIGVVVVAFLVIFVSKICKLQKQNEIEFREKYMKRYEIMRDDIEKEVERYLSVTEPYCNAGMPQQFITHISLYSNGTLGKGALIDVDGETYCKVYVPYKCVKSGDYSKKIPGELEWDVYLSCKYYEDEGFKDKDVSIEEYEIK